MNNLSFSFEVFPPKTDKGLASLGRATREIVAERRPAYISVTYGAGGSTKEKSFDAFDVVSDNADGVPIAGHLTCVGQTRDEIERIIDRFEQHGVNHIVALRGDPPEGIDAPYYPHPDGFTTTPDLVAAIKARGDFKVTVSAYPEVHLQSPNLKHDLDLLARKIDAGADAAMTQMFFDNDSFERYLDAADAHGIAVPIIPGVFPIHHFEKVAGFAARCGAAMPERIAERFEPFADDPEKTFDIAVDTAAEQIVDLAERGVEHVHLYTLNKSPLSLAVLERLDGTARRAAEVLSAPIPQN